MYGKSLKPLAPIIAVAMALAIGLPRIGAEKTPILVLNDASPTADVSITLDNGAPGAVYLELQNVALSLRDASGADLLTISDPRVTALGVQIAQDAPVQTLHLERIAGVSVAQAHIVAQPTLPGVESNTPRTGANASAPVLAGLASTTLEIAPAAALPIFVDQTNNRLNLEVSNGQSVVQIIDITGAVLLSARAGGTTTSLMLQLAEGRYALVAANPDRGTASSAYVSLSAGQPSSLPNVASVAQAAAPAPACQALILDTTTVRSGPGTAYSALGTASAGVRLAVGGVNREGGWMLVQGASGTAWVPANAGLLSGNCTGLPVYNVPLRDTSFEALRTAPDTAARQSSFGDAEHENDGGEGGHDD